MIQRSLLANPFEFAVVAGLRAAQLTRGCTPRMEGIHKHTVMAQMEVAAGMVVRDADPVQPAVEIDGELENIMASHPADA